MVVISACMLDILEQIMLNTTTLMAILLNVIVFPNLIACSLQYIENYLIGMILQLFDERRTETGLGSFRP